MQQRHIKHPFPAVIDARSRVLILGSVPSVKSAEKGFYYMHPQNRFYKVMSQIVGEELYSKPIEQKIDILLSHHIALYDSVEECDILGSSDSHISNIIPADIPSLILGTQIEHIFCNGAASYKYLISYHPSLAPIATQLPSTSPANAAFSLSRLIECWQPISNFLSR